MTNREALLGRHYVDLGQFHIGVKVLAPPQWDFPKSHCERKGETRTLPTVK